MLLSEKRWRGFFVVLLAAVLSACGGGGSSDGGGGGPSGGGSSGDDDPVPGDQRPASPEVSLTIEAIKTLRFDWADVADATAYKLLENPDGMSGFTPVVEAIEPGAATLELTVPLYARVNAQYILQACNAVGCSDSDTLSVSGNLVSGIGYFKASNSEADDQFGWPASLSADGDTLVVGAVGEDSDAVGVNGGDQGNNLADTAGAVYVFTREADGWSQQAYLKASNTDGNDGFGVSVSLSADGDTLAVGAKGEASGKLGDQNDNVADAAGAVYVFIRNDGVWSQQAYLKAGDTDANDRFGFAVSLSADGDTLAVGATGEGSVATGVNGDGGDNSAPSSGAVYVFARDAADTWSQQAYLKADNTDAGDHFGSAVSLSADGDTLVVGAIGEDGDASDVSGLRSNDVTESAGAVYVFTRKIDVWSQQAYLKAGNAGAGDQFGWAVSLSADGRTLAVSATFEDGAASGVNGAQEDNSVVEAGAVYVFAREAGAWSQQAYLKGPNAEVEDYFGFAVSLSGDGQLLAVGALGEDSGAIGFDGDQSNNSAVNAGAVYVFSREAEAWSQQAYLKASNTDAHDWFGASVSLSAYGDTLAVGAYGEGGAAKKVGGEQGNNSAPAAGAVYLY